MEEQGDDGRHNGDEEADGGNDSDQVRRSGNPEDDGDGGDLHDDDDRWPPGHRQIDCEDVRDEDEDQHTAIAVEFKDRLERREPE